MSACTFVDNGHRCVFGIDHPVRYHHLDNGRNVAIGDATAPPDLVQTNPPRELPPGVNLAARVHALIEHYDGAAQVNLAASTQAESDGLDPHAAWFATLGVAYDQMTRELREIAAELPSRPRVWRDGDDIPAGTWVLDSDGRIERVGEDEPVGEPIRMVGFGTLVEVVLPDYDAEVAHEAAEQTGVAR